MPLSSHDWLTLLTPARQFWQEETDHTPQARYEMQKKQEAFKRAEELKRDPPKPKPQRRLFKGGTAGRWLLHALMVRRLGALWLGCMS